MAAAKSWKVQGEYFESCNCEVLCPCLLSSATANPTEGHCDVVLAFHVEKGNFGSTDISGLNAVQALITPGPMAKGGGTFALYVDKRANQEQHAALEAIFGGTAGGPPSLLAGMVSRRLPTKSAQIDFSASGRKRKLTMPGIAEVAIEGIAGRGGNDVVWFDNVGHPLSSRIAAAKGIDSHYRDHSLNFENSGRNGHFSPINWSSD